MSMKEFFITLIVQPFYNALILLMDFFTADLGIAIIVLTIIFRFILFPLSRSQIRTQIKMREIQEPLKELRKKYKDQPEKQGREMMDLYKKHGVNPFSGILLLLIQLPLLIGFYWVFLRAGLPEINLDLIYASVPRPENISTMFLGIVDMTEKSAFLAALVGITQYIQVRILLPKKSKDKDSAKSEGGTMEEVMKSVQSQMSFVMPIVLTGIAYSFGAIIALYFLVGNIFSIGQELYLRKTLKHK